MLSKISLYNFKNHKEVEFNFGFFNLIIGQNGSGKTNILESIYLLVNSYIYSSKKFKDIMNFTGENIIISGDFSDDNFIIQNNKITYDSLSEKTSYICDSSKITRPKYFTTLKTVAVFFSPSEINIIYLGPSIRRDFLDDVCLLSDQIFLKIKTDYQKILKNRNKLLKNINEGKAEKSDLKYWNDVFIDICIKYYKSRKKMLNFINERISYIEDLLSNKYKLKFNYISKTDLGDIENSIRTYIESNIDRDIILGCTYIGPHLDDFEFLVNTEKGYISSKDILSRGENKSILIGLKFLEIYFYLENHTENIIILLDDIFSELDDDHISKVLSLSEKFQTFISSQNLPVFLHNNSDLNIIKI